MKICPVGAELFCEDGRTDWYEEANGRFRNFAKAPDNWWFHQLEVLKPFLNIQINNAVRWK
jgi:hypothetical protein